MSDAPEGKEEAERQPEPEKPERRRLTRSATDRLLTGVCGGLGKHLGVDSLLVRLVFVLLAMAGGVGVILYLALALLVPREDHAHLGPRETAKAGVEELGQQAKAAAVKLAGVFSGSKAEEGAAPPEPAPPARRAGRGAGSFFVGAVLVVLGVWFLADNLGLRVPWWMGMDVLWPLVLVGLGVILLARRARGGSK